MHCMKRSVCRPTSNQQYSYTFHLPNVNSDAKNCKSGSHFDCDNCDIVVQWLLASYLCKLACREVTKMRDMQCDIGNKGCRNLI